MVLDQPHLVQPVVGPAATRRQAREVVLHVPWVSTKVQLAKGGVLDAQPANIKAPLAKRAVVYALPASMTQEALAHALLLIQVWNVCSISIKILILYLQ